MKARAPHLPLLAMGQWLHSPPEPQFPYLSPGHLHTSPRVDAHIKQEMKLSSTLQTAKCRAHVFLTGAQSQGGWMAHHTDPLSPPQELRAGGDAGQGATFSQVRDLASPWDRGAMG